MADIGNSCSAADLVAPDYLFSSKDYGAVLAFDLRDENQPVVTVVINRSSEMGSDSVNVALPFRVKQSSQNENALFRVGYFSNWTLVTYSEDEKSTWPQRISLIPVGDNVPETAESNEDLKGSLYFWQRGQDWRFLYRYPKDDRSGGFSTSFYRLPLRPFDAIAVALPQDVRRLEVRGKSAMPEHISENTYARYYPPKPYSAGEPFLEIRYSLQPNSVEKVLFKYGPKLIAALSPIIGIIFFKIFSNRPFIKWVFLSISGITYLIFVVILTRFASRLGENGQDALVDWIMLGGSAIVGLITLWFGQEDPNAPTNRVARPRAPAPAGARRP